MGRPLPSRHRARNLASSRRIVLSPQDQSAGSTREVWTRSYRPVKPGHRPRRRASGFRGTRTSGRPAAIFPSTSYALRLSECGLIEPCSARARRGTSREFIWISFTPGSRFGLRERGAACVKHVVSVNVSSCSFAVRRWGLHGHWGLPTTLTLDSPPSRRLQPPTLECNRQPKRAIFFQPVEGGPNG